MAWMTNNQGRGIVKQVQFNYNLIENISKKVDSYSTKFSEYDTKIADLDTKVSSYDSKIEEITVQLDNVRDQYTTISVIDIPELHDKINTNAQNINNLEINYTNLYQKVDDNHTEFLNFRTDSKSSFDNINTGITTIKNNIETNVTNISNLDINKQDKLTAGTGITIENNVISSSGGSSTDVYLISGSITMSDNNYYFYEIYSTDSTLTVGQYTYTELYNKLLKNTRILDVYNDSISGIFKKLYIQSGYCVRYSNTGTIELRDTYSKVVKTRINYIYKI